MKRIERIAAGCALLAASSATLAAGGAAEPFAIARRGERPGCAIVVAKNAGECERYAARELQKYAKAIAGVELPILSDDMEPAPVRAVVLGAGEPDLPPDAFRLCVSNGFLRVSGGSPRGTLFGVYGLLERFGGCGFFAPWCETVPEASAFAVPGDLDVVEKPAFETRYSSWRVNHPSRDEASRAMMAKYRFDSSREARFGGGSPRWLKKNGNCHTFFRFVPPEEHFAAHPEWFSEIGGVRVGVRSQTQLCWSNRELVAFIVDEIRRRLREDPEAKFVGISQEDHAFWCQCAECRRCAEEEGSPAGPNLKFVNAIAEALEAEFPDVTFETLAYQFTRRPPKNIRPRRNVTVCLCSFECSFSMPFAESAHASTAAFREDLRKWGEICESLMVYDYSTDFRNYLMPFPNLYSLAPNYRLFRDCNVRWLYSQGAADGFHAEFGELKPWLIGKLMWNPDQPVEPLVDRFVEGYYGAAAPQVRRYLRELYGALNVGPEHNVDFEAEPCQAGIFAENLSKVSDEMLLGWEALWREAEEAVKDDPVRLYNVRMGSLPVVYTYLKRLYERGWKTVWAAEDLAPHIARFEALRAEAAKFMALCDESAALKRGICLTETYRRHRKLMADFRACADWRPPDAGRGTAVVGTNTMVLVKRDNRARMENVHRLPLRLVAVDPGARYRVRAHLRRKEPEPLPDGLAHFDADFGYIAGLDVDWLTHAEGTKRVKFPKEAVSDDWAWREVGEWDISELQKIPLPILDGLCIFVAGDIELDMIEIAKVGTTSH